MLREITLCLLAICALSAPAAAQGDSVAQRYVAAYSRADWDEMARYMSEDITFEDRTNLDSSAVMHFDGRPAVLAMMRDFGARGGIVELGLEFVQSFESSGVAVFSGRVNTLNVVPGTRKAYRWRAAQVIILTIRDGKVVRHEDFADYAHAVIEQVPLDSPDRPARTQP